MKSPDNPTAGRTFCRMSPKDPPFMYSKTMAICKDKWVLNCHLKRVANALHAT